MSLFLAPQTLPFGVALGVMVGLAVIEGIGVFMAGSPSAWIESLLPHHDAAEFAVDGGFDGPLGWLHVGRVPLLVLLILFLLGFALCGYMVQMLARGTLGSFVPAWIAVLPSFLMGLAVVRGLGTLIAHIVPKDETSAVSERSLIGRAGVVTAGIARAGMAAQAKVRDAHGRAHYVMVEPDVAQEEFAEGAAVLLVSKEGARFKAIRNPHPNLL
jgi:hypothetical protein